MLGTFADLIHQWHFFFCRLLISSPLLHSWSSRLLQLISRSSDFSKQLDQVRTAGSMEVEQDLHGSYKGLLVQLGKGLRRGLKRWYLPPAEILSCASVFNKKIMTFCGVHVSVDMNRLPQSLPHRFRAIILLLCMLTLTTIMYYSSNRSVLS